MITSKDKSVLYGIVIVALLALAIGGVFMFPTFFGQPQAQPWQTVERAAPAPEEMTLRQQFEREYAGSGGEKKGVFQKYLPSLGPGVLLDFLESTYRPVCHGQSHELGQAIYLHTKDLTTALEMCQERCTSGCMHGVVTEAFKGQNLRDVAKQGDVFCAEGKMAELHKLGSCAHGFGHVFMLLQYGDLNAAHEGCSAFGMPAMQYYCETGVYMEYFIQNTQPVAAIDDPSPPCEQALYPFACYHFKVQNLLNNPKNTHPQVIEQCLGLGAVARRGCFRGFGSMMRLLVYQNPAALSGACAAGDTIDRIMCIEGVIEGLNNMSKETALAACDTLAVDELKSACTSSALEGSYRLDKPTLVYYLGKS